MMLDTIVAHKKEEIAQRKRTLSIGAVKENAVQRIATRDFMQALLPGFGNTTRIIAEIKKASPSKGIIRQQCSPGEIATIYENAGAAAISIITDSKFFQGNLDYLTLVRAQVALPLLCKDFILDPYQIYEAAHYGADAVLLIAALLSQQQLEEFLCIGKELHMSALVEVHSEHELDRVLSTPAPIIGINNRNLHTFTTDTSTTLRLMRFVPKGKLVVSESGIRDREQIKALESAGVHAFLIGEALMKEHDPGKKLRELMGEQ